MKIKEANEIIANYMNEKIISVKGYVNILKDDEEIPAGYHSSYDWILPVAQKLYKSGDLSNKIVDKLKYLDFDIYSDIVDNINALEKKF